MSVLFICYLVCIAVCLVDARPQGAPLQACGTMIPGHSGSGENSQSPFTTKPTNVEIMSNGVLELTLDGGSEKFKGFLVMAFDNSTDSISKPLGTFTAGSSSQTIDCSSGTKNAVTHISNGLKGSVVVTWTPPEDYEGFVVFKTTYVKDFSTFWVKQPSTAVRVKRAFSQTTSTTASPSSTTIKKPSLQGDIQTAWQSILGLPSPGQVTSAKTELKTRTLLLAQLLLKEVGRDSFQVSIAHATSEKHQLKLRTLLLAQLLLKEIDQTID